MQNARQENSEPHQLRISPSVDDHVEEHIKTGGLHDEEDACRRHTTTSLHLLSIVQSLEYATQCTLPLPRTYALPPSSSIESFVPRASPVQDPSLSRILDMPQSENAALRAQIADLTKQLTLFLSRVTSVLSLPSLSLPPRSLPQAPVPAPRLLSLVQQRLPLLRTMPHLKPKLPTNAPVSPMPRNLSHPSLTPQPRASGATSRTPRPHHSSQETPYCRPPPACLCWQHPA
ncbi:hypothetical protein DSO57_1023713 [Entomophthora muscae]|uniref:Uncharacterized protein n=1 Tax=Entomophthora muscae TaxID=34485 RepID=A0ACC2UBU2_9FUNG|nr:hypothetical protein DSO57_1023713 [Entomophthora muscae]